MHKKAVIRMRINPADIALKSGEICQKVLLGDRKCGMSLNMFSDSARKEGNIAYMQQCGFH